VSDRAAVARVAEEVGPVDLLFNNAGVSGSDAARIVAVNLGGVINGCELFRPATRVINTASLLGARPSPRRAAYSASKAGVIAYSLALHESGVAVSIVLPHVRSAIEREDPDGPEAAYVAMGAAPIDAAADVLAGVDAGALWIVAGTDPDPILAQVSHFPR
jgi:NAD(P)-dependent dehydrogenase (short-subunit alcohol dehydrogenase family)